MATLRIGIDGVAEASSPEQGLGRLARWWRRRSALDELRYLSDAQLRDIGVERQDVGLLIERDLTRFLRCW
jgi:uncharacterized protein YjiS (DUF1127 family)